jgi:hypothetical protein
MAWRSEDLERLLLGTVPARIYRRGEDYLARGRVLEWWQEGDALVGRVLGSYGHVYETRVWLLGDEPEAACTCPYGDFCKHAVALALAAAREEGGTARPAPESGVYAGAAGPPDKPLPVSRSGPHPPALPKAAPAEPPPGTSPDAPASRPAPSSARRVPQKEAERPAATAPSWEEFLSLALEQWARPEPERGLKYLVYRLYPHEQGLGLTLGVARYGARGLGTETPFYYDPWSPYTAKWPPGATELDRRVLQLVQKRGYPAEYVIPAPLVGAALELFFHLPFVFWGEAAEPIAPGGPPLLARLTVEEAGDLRLRAVLYGPDGREWTPPAGTAYLLAGRLWVIYRDRFFREVVAPCDWRQFLHRLRHFGGVGSAPLPRGLKADLRPYQRHGYDWLCFLRDHGLHGVLADEMGLGKTVQVLALLLAEKEGDRAAGPSLVVVPTSLVWNWVDEARRFTPDLRVVALVGQQRHRLFDRLQEYDLAVTT